MNDGPSERWIRDALFTRPAILDLLFQAGISYDEKLEFQAWREYKTPGGFVDILIAFDGHVVVVECKKDLADESAIAQCLRYMGSLQFKCYGVVAAQRFTQGAIYAARMVEDFSLVRLAPSVESYEVEDGFDGTFDRALFAVAWPNEDPAETFELAPNPTTVPLLSTETSEIEAAPLPVLSGALEGGGGAADVLVSGARSVDRHDVRNA